MCYILSWGCSTSATDIPLLSVNPNCPFFPLPHTMTRPSVVSIAECRKPDATVFTCGTSIFNGILVKGVWKCTDLLYYMKNSWIEKTQIFTQQLYLVTGQKQVFFYVFHNTMPIFYMLKYKDFSSIWNYRFWQRGFLKFSYGWKSYKL